MLSKVSQKCRGHNLDGSDSTCIYLSSPIEFSLIEGLLRIPFLLFVKGLRSWLYSMGLTRTLSEAIQVYHFFIAIVTLASMRIITHTLLAFYVSLCVYSRPLPLPPYFN